MIRQIASKSARQIVACKRTITRLFCSFPNHDTTLTVILNLPFANTKCRYVGAENGKNSLHRQEHGHGSK